MIVYVVQYVSGRIHSVHASRDGMDGADATRNRINRIANTATGLAVVESWEVQGTEHGDGNREKSKC